MSKTIEHNNLAREIKELKKQVRDLAIQNKQLMQIFSDVISVSRLDELSNNTGTLFVRNSGSSEVVKISGADLRVEVKDGSNVIGILGEE